MEGTTNKPIAVEGRGLTEDLNKSLGYREWIKGERGSISLTKY